LTFIGRESKIKNMGNAGRNGGEYYSPRPLVRAIRGQKRSLLRIAQMTWINPEYT